MKEPDPKTNVVAGEVIGSAIEVHRHLGAGLLEGVYERALAIELRGRNIRFQLQVPVTLDYKGVPVGQGRMDMLVEDRLVVELKAVDALVGAHRAQLLSYLRSSGQELGLLINFNTPLLKHGVQRLIQTQVRG